jgi:hypothetical protein
VSQSEEDLDGESPQRMVPEAERVMERRGVERLKQRLTCELVMGDRRHPGIVLDVSPTGLFVQTSASPPPGERVRLKLRRSGGAEIEVEASVARRYVVPRRLVSVARGGVGLRIESAFDEYLQLVRSALRTEEEPPPEATASASPQSSEGSAYRVRAKQTSGPRSRSLQVTAASEEEAKQMASAKLDEGWEILTVDLVGA